MESIELTMRAIRRAYVENHGLLQVARWKLSRSMFDLFLSQQLQERRDMFPLAEESTYTFEGIPIDVIAIDGYLLKLDSTDSV